jgi:hypothetical protein
VQAVVQAQRLWLVMLPLQCSLYRVAVKIGIVLPSGAWHTVRCRTHQLSHQVAVEVQ